MWLVHCKGQLTQELLGDQVEQGHLANESGRLPAGSAMQNQPNRVRQVTANVTAARLRSLHP